MLQSAVNTNSQKVHFPAKNPHPLIKIFNLFLCFFTLIYLYRFNEFGTDEPRQIIQFNKTCLEVLGNDLSHFLSILLNTCEEIITDM